MARGYYLKFGRKEIYIEMDRASPGGKLYESWRERDGSPIMTILRGRLTITISQQGEHDSNEQEDDEGVTDCGGRGP